MSNPFRLLKNLNVFNKTALSYRKCTSAGNLEETLAVGLRRRERASLAKAITLIETTNQQKKLRANALINTLLSEAQERLKTHGPKSLSLRIGLSGPPGAGKSTFVESFGKSLTSRGFRVAVLAVDPSSLTTGGSILGDKTRMPELTVDPNAYIRPSPARGHLGGVTRSTNEAIVLCEAAGYDVIIVETVGVGQSEVSVADMVDLFALIISPAGGDELQGLKKGIVEMCDVVIVNKSDGDFIPAAIRTQSEYLSSMKFMKQKTKDWRVPVLRVSSLTKEGIDELWKTIESFRNLSLDSGQLISRRRQQQKAWLNTHLREAVMKAFMNTDGMKEVMRGMEDEVMEGLVSPGAACDSIMRRYTELMKE